MSRFWQLGMSHFRQLQGSFRLFPLNGQGPHQLTLRALRQNHLARLQRGFAKGLRPVQIALKMPRRHASRLTVDERLQMRVQGVDPSEAQLSPFGVELRFPMFFRGLASGGLAGYHHVRGLRVPSHPKKSLPAVGAQDRSVLQAREQRVRDVVPIADHPLQLVPAAVHRGDHGNLLVRRARLVRPSPAVRRSRCRRPPPLPVPASLEAFPKEGLVGLDHAGKRLRIRIGKRLQNHRSPTPQRGPRHGDSAELVQIVERLVARSHRPDEPLPQLGLAHAGERSARQAVERAAASALPPHAEKALPASRVDAVPMRACASAARTDSADVSVPGMVRDRGETRLGLSPRLNMPLDVGELVGIQFVQQLQDELVDRAIDHKFI